MVDSSITQSEDDGEVRDVGLKNCFHAVPSRGVEQQRIAGGNLDQAIAVPVACTPRLHVDEGLPGMLNDRPGSPWLRESKHLMNMASSGVISLT